MWLLLNEERNTWLLVGHLFEAKYDQLKMKLKHASSWTSYVELFISENECEDIQMYFPPSVPRALNKTVTKDE